MSFKKEFYNFLDTHKRERNGLAVLACLMIACLLLLSYLSFFYEPDFSEMNDKMKENYNAYKTHLEKTKLEQDSALQREPNSNQTKSKKPTKELFPFDPNTVSDANWKKLGLNSGQIKSINNYKKKGGKFYKAQDVSKMYTISDKQYQELLPYIKIEKPKKEKKKWKDPPDYKDNPETTKSEYIQKPKKREPHFININIADTTELKKLKGIGSFYASKIVEERTKLGGFHSTDQLLEIWNFKPEMLTAISEEIHLGDTPIDRININTCQIEELSAHPYISWKQANSIVKYRAQHGAYQSILDIQKSHLISEALCQKIKPYLTIE